MGRRAMRQKPQTWCVTDVHPNCARAMELLWEARQHTAAGTDPWPEAVPLPEFSAAGVRRGDLRRLVLEGLIEYRVEVTAARAKRRRFRVWHSPAIPDGSCFELTARGVQAARREVPPVPDRPRWDGARLWWGDEVIKAPAKHARSQRLALAECQRCGWKNPIDVRSIVPARVDRSHWAVNMVRHLNNRLLRIRFRADGTKHAISWKCLEQ